MSSRTTTNSLTRACDTPWLFKKSNEKFILGKTNILFFDTIIKLTSEKGDNWDRNPEMQGREARLSKETEKSNQLPSGETKITVSKV